MGQDRCRAGSVELNRAELVRFAPWPLASGQKKKAPTGFRAFKGRMQSRSPGLPFTYALRDFGTIPNLRGYALQPGRALPPAGLAGSVYGRAPVRC